MKRLAKKNDSSPQPLEVEVKSFVSGLPYWAKFLSDKILSGSQISDQIIEKTYQYLLEDLKLKPKTLMRRLNLKLQLDSQGVYFKDLKFTQLEDVKGVNALIEDQIIEFGPNLTIIYGSNGSGKSGYVRLLKKVFYSKAPEEILSNIYSTYVKKPITGKFTFKTDNGTIIYKYPNQSSETVFSQFSVFDEKSVLNQLDQRNEFEFRPAGLAFFSELTDALKRIELKLNSDITIKNSANIFIDLFDGGSEVKSNIERLSYSTKIEDLKKFIPLSKSDIEKKRLTEKKYNDLLISSKRKAKEISNLESIKSLLKSNKEAINDLNKFFSISHINHITETINEYLRKEIIAKSEGIESLRSNTIKLIGSAEWKAFIEAAEEFAKMQSEPNKAYPIPGDFCIFCHQPLSNAAIVRINNYWNFLKSDAEKNVKSLNSKLNKIKSALEDLDFDLFHKNHLLTIWLAGEYPNTLKSLTNKLARQKKLSLKLIDCINNKVIKDFDELIVGLDRHDKIIEKVNASIKLLKDSKEDIELARLLKIKTQYSHREKLPSLLTKIEKFINDQKWIYCATQLNWQSLRLQITTTEKQLSNKFFNQKYIDTFNLECKKLNGEFGINIDARSSEAKTNRKLLIKGISPSSILSEGEQKVIAIADFLSEMKLSEINKGLVFDDPVNSLDEQRKDEIAGRLVQESVSKQVIIFTHDLVFVSSLISWCQTIKIQPECHWIEMVDRQPGMIYLNNTPSYESLYKSSGKAHEYYDKALKLEPEKREDIIKQGFAALRSSYESLVIFDLFNAVVLRFNDRVSFDRLSGVNFDNSVRDELLDNLAQCCRYMEGHLHSDKYTAKKPNLDSLKQEIARFDSIKKKISDLKKKINKP